MRVLNTIMQGWRGRTERRSAGPRYHGSFGGLWTDRLDATDEIDRRLAAGAFGPEDAERLRTWCANGYLLLERAVDPQLCDQVRADIEQAWTSGDERMLVAAPGEQPRPLSRGEPTEKMRAVDTYGIFESARQALFAEPIVRFLRLIFEDRPQLFQSLSFEQGSQQGLHQDSAFVVVSSPLELAASWIALQDVTAGSGELMYLEGSHRLPEYVFGGERKHYDSELDRKEDEQEWTRLIHENAEKMGLERRTFLPRKGDVLLWHADLAHGGSVVEDDQATRKSLVGHYCPRRCQPHYFSYLAERRTVVDWGDGAYSSAYHALQA
jgi:phytanoyl-CoA hydroxylase